ncbi:hypothetical protein CWI37_2451p0010 [Hamiltosporidium tvaerminnensis]|uniref:RRM domain-containing protein n=1 Tax=Hamiltosporidium tvaerminnensis TaxID=1176355 RepID=A0A4Q9KRU6_9MICR|nr:hypothetical protein LUQ84_001043 [Hamiltosporidium tvaerminnensis]TBT97175.1 hypothetical protein CWI37_2451p0010 [Hamiltosporidium tvaerminnensis]
MVLPLNRRIRRQNLFSDPMPFIYAIPYLDDILESNIYISKEDTQYSVLTNLLKLKRTDKDFCYSIYADYTNQAIYNISDEIKLNKLKEILDKNFTRYKINFPYLYFENIQDAIKCLFLSNSIFSFYLSKFFKILPADSNILYCKFFGNKFVKHVVHDRDKIIIGPIDIQTDVLRDLINDISEIEAFSEYYFIDNYKIYNNCSIIKSDTETSFYISQSSNNKIKTGEICNNSKEIDEPNKKTKHFIEVTELNEIEDIEEEVKKLKYINEEVKEINEIEDIKEEVKKIEDIKEELNEIIEVRKYNEIKYIKEEVKEIKGEIKNILKSKKNNFYCLSFKNKEATNPFLEILSNIEVEGIPLIARRAIDNCYVLSFSQMIPEYTFISNTITTSLIKTRFVQILNFFDFNENLHFNFIETKIYNLCSQITEVKSIKIPDINKEGLLSHIKCENKGKIFVECISIEGAENICKKIGGSVFENRLIICSFYSELLYICNDFN